MVRSKFPGKPSKIISRKIVDSAKFTLLEDNESTEAAENISYGLAMFNGSFGGDSQMETSFHGFSPHEIEESSLASKHQKAKVEAEYEVNGLNKNSKDVVKILLDPPQVQILENDPSLLPWVEVAKSHSWKGSTSVLSSCSHSNNASGIPGSPKKVVLPNRSIHSTRVIKPNKRFLDLEDPSSTDEKESSPQIKQLRTIELKKPRLILHDIKSAVMSASGSSPSDNNLFRTFLTSSSLIETLESKCHWKACDKVQIGLGDLNVFGASVSQPCFHSVQSANNSSSLQNIEEHNYFSQSSSVIGRFSKVEGSVQKFGRISRRNSRSFPLSVKSETSPDGLLTLRSKKSIGFSHSKVHKSSGTPVQCGVCGAVRVYRFVKQARKFGIDSCESCRKFIAKMIIRARSGENFVTCLSGNGSCAVPAIIRTTDSNSRENRCWACWLKMCVQCYIQMPDATRDALVAMLPAYMNSDRPGDRPKRKARQSRVSVNVKMSSPRIAARSKRMAAESGNKQDAGVGIPNRTERPTRLKELKTIAAAKGQESVQTTVARQQLLLRGPRVKHVCRSASAVLGQPIAVFPAKTTAAAPKEPAHGPTASTKQAEVEPCRPSRSAEARTSRANSQQSTGRDTANSNQSGHSAGSGRRITRLPQNPNSNPFRAHARSLQALSVYNAQPEVVPDLVALDFWESYDPDEVCNTGFGLIGCDPFQVRAVCFLCGSAGTSKLIHCASCCEPYHKFCVEVGIPSSEEEDRWLVDWVCPRCTVCNGCGWSTGPQIRCQRCERSYHVNCLGTTAIKARQRAPDRAWVCSECLRCKSCNGPDVVKFVGNLPFCKPCFKLRRKGSFCPLCQCCYNDNDFVSKMMECAECKAWVHAKCEGLSDEEYQVLSYLPETVEFVCRLCCTSPPAPWRAAIVAELKGGYLNVLKALSKNRKACTLLKWSPRKACSCQKTERTSLQSGRRRLSFSSTSVAGRQNEQSKNPVTVDKTVLKPEISLYDFDDEENEIGKYMNKARVKKSQECHDNESTGSQEKGGQFSPLTGSQSDSGIGSTDDEFKACSAAEDEETDVVERENKLLSCCDICESISPIPSLLQIKKKANSDQYSSILEFHQDMDSVMREAESEELRDLYHYTLQEIFPWFDPNYPNMSHNWRDAGSPCKQSYGSVLHRQSIALPREKSSSIPDAVNKLICEGVDKMGKDYFYSSDIIPDARVCGLCKCKGDCASVEQGRLLYCGYNEWVHVNCALWSGDVFEEIDGSLQNISSVLSRSRSARCPACSKKGASVGCYAKNCQETYHFPCARTVGCSFMEDRTVYCPSHVRDSLKKTPAKDSDFCVYRPVYVELDRRKKRTVESRQVRLMIGSLLVESLGTILPEVSDWGTTLVPTSFRCSRLFWSVKEPWRIAQYTIRTSVQMPAQDEASNEHHITVDHSKESEATENLSIIASTNHDVLSEKPCSEKDLESDKVSALVESIQTDVTCVEPPDAEVVRDVMNSLLDNVCTRETEEEVSDPQNSADLLPPELKDAIFEELPHDLLDGISMQDIFPRFLNLEDQSKEDFCEDICDSVPQVMRDVRPSNNCSQGLTDNAAPAKNNLVNVTKRLKRSKSDVLPDHVASTDNRLHQRSCSLAWSCKLDTTISRCKRSMAGPESEGERSRIIQQLHLSVTPASSVDAQYHFLGGDKENHSIGWRHAQTQIMQVDGAVDADFSDGFNSSQKWLLAKPLVCSRESRSSGQSEISSKTKKWCKRKPKTLRPRLSRLRTVRVGSQAADSDKRRDKWRRVRETKSYVIPQLDGALEASSDSEPEDTLTRPVNLQPYSLLEEQPVRCDRCHCTYRTEMSYTRHLPTCTGDLSMSSGSEEEHSDDEAIADPEPLKEVIVPESDTSVKPPPPAVAEVTKPIQVPPPPVAIPEKRPPVPILEKKTPVPILEKKTPVPILEKKPPAPNLVLNPPNPIPATTTKTQTTTVNYTITTGENSGTASAPQQAVGATMTTSYCQPRIQIQQPMVAMMDYQSQPPSQPTVIVQCVPSQSMMPAYVDAFQQHTGQTLQHLATIEGAYYAVPNPVLTPRTYQLQATPDGQLRLEPTNQVGLPHLGLQIAQPQSQVVGTIIPGGLQCGVVTNDQVYPAGNMLLAGQPMLTCMETVVSNTYMSMSQNQFVPGMLSNSSSFSSTTQVFQAGKVDQTSEPHASYIVNANSQVPGQVVVRSQQPSDSVFQLASNSSHKQNSVQVNPCTEQVTVHDVFTQPLVTQPQTITSLSLPTLAQAASVSSKPVIHHQRTYSKSFKTDVAPLTTAQANSKAVKLSRAPQAIRPIAPARPSTQTSHSKKTDIRLPLAQGVSVSNKVNQDLFVAPAQSITLPDPIALALTSDDSLSGSPVPPTTSIANTVSTSLSTTRNCNVPKSIAVVHPIPVSTYLSHDKSKSAPLKKIAIAIPKTCVVPTTTSVTLSLKPLSTQPIQVLASITQPSSVSTTHAKNVPVQLAISQAMSGLALDRLSSVQSKTCELSRPLESPASKVSLPPPPPSSITATLSKTTPPAMPSLVCRTISAIPPISAPTIVTASCTAAVTSTLSCVRPVSTVLPTSCLSPLSKSPAKEGKSISRRRTSAGFATSPEGKLISPVPAKKQSCSPRRKILPAASTGPPTIDLPPTAEDPSAAVTVIPPTLRDPHVGKSVCPSNSPERKFGANRTSSQTINAPELNKEEEEENKPQSTLKLLFQKQAHSGRYKVCTSPGKWDNSSAKFNDFVTHSYLREKNSEKDQIINNSSLTASSLQPEDSENVNPGDKSAKKSSASTPKVVYEIQCDDGFTYSSTSISDAWQKVFGAVQEARANHTMAPLVHNPFVGMEAAHNVLGLGNNSLKYLLEQLPNVGQCTQYRPVYHKSRLPSGPGSRLTDERPIRESSSGCARTDPFACHKKFDMFSWLDSRHRCPPKLLDSHEVDGGAGRRATSMNLPMAMRFRHLRETSRVSVGVFRSDIHGRGLFCLRDIEAGEMVIEYAGEVIRNTLTDNRERYYQSKGIGCYMFKVDENFTVDATRRGNAARFINHSCEPNCYSRVVDILGKKHIIIFAFRRIPQGEELTYDYKFPIEDEKISCHCLSRRCRKYLN